MRPSGVSGGPEPHSGQCSGTAGAHGTSTASSPASAYTIALLHGARRLVWWDDSHRNAIPFPDKAKKCRLLRAHNSQPFPSQLASTNLTAPASASSRASAKAVSSREARVRMTNPSAARRCEASTLGPWSALYPASAPASSSLSEPSTGKEPLQKGLHPKHERRCSRGSEWRFSVSEGASRLMQAEFWALPI